MGACDYGDYITDFRMDFNSNFAQEVGYLKIIIEYAKTTDTAK